LSSNAIIRVEYLISCITHIVYTVQAARWHRYTAWHGC